MKSVSLWSASDRRAFQYLEQLFHLDARDHDDRLKPLSIVVILAFGTGLPQGVTVTDVWPRPSGPVACVTVTVMIFVPALA